MSISHFRSAIIELARRRALYRYKLGKQSCAPTGVGNFNDMCIFIVGEAHTPNFRPVDGVPIPVGKAQYPFCSMEGCSGWLNILLEESRIPEEELFWVNAMNLDGSYVDLEAMISFINPRKLIALGGLANKEMLRTKKQFERFPHPQYWKRFKSGKKYPFISMLEEETIHEVR